MAHKAWRYLGEMPYYFSRSSVKLQSHTAREMPYYFSRSSIKLQGHTAKNNRRFWTKVGFSELWLQFELTNGYKMMHKARSSIEGVPYLSNFKVARDKNSSMLTQIGRFWTVTPVWIHWWLWNDAQSLKQHGRGALMFSKVIRHISRSHGTKKIADFVLNMSVSWL